MVWSCPLIQNSWRAAVPDIDVLSGVTNTLDPLILLLGIVDSLPTKLDNLTMHTKLLIFNAIYARKTNLSKWKKAEPPQQSLHGNLWLMLPYPYYIIWPTWDAIAPRNSIKYRLVGWKCGTSRYDNHALCHPSGRCVVAGPNSILCLCSGFCILFPSLPFLYPSQLPTSAPIPLSLMPSGWEVSINTCWIISQNYSFLLDYLYLTMCLMQLSLPILPV